MIPALIAVHGEILSGCCGAGAITRLMRDVVLLKFTSRRVAPRMANLQAIDTVLDASLAIESALSAAGH